MPSRCSAFPPVDGFRVGGHPVEDAGDELGGDFVIDYADPGPSPAPVTTIARRLAYVITGVFGWVADHFGGPPVDYHRLHYAGTAAQALGQLDQVYAQWLAGVTSLGDAGLARPCGPAEGPSPAT